jgi:hypothetical protein
MAHRQPFGGTTLGATLSEFSLCVEAELGGKFFGQRSDAFIKGLKAMNKVWLRGGTDASSLGCLTRFL